MACKKCTKCSDAKPLTEFNKRAASPDGLQPQCKECEKDYKRKNRVRNVARIKAWRQANAEHVKEYSEEYYTKNRDRWIEYSRGYAEKYRSKVNARIRAYNKTKAGKDRQRRYRLKHKHKVYDKNARRRARLKGATVERVDRMEIYRRDNGKCGICLQSVGIDEMTLDHIVPLSKGGEHSCSNVQVAHLICNSSKGNRAQ